MERAHPFIWFARERYTKYVTVCVLTRQRVRCSRICVENVTANVCPVLRITSRQLVLHGIDKHRGEKSRLLRENAGVCD